MAIIKHICVVAFDATRNSDPTRWYGPAGMPNDLAQLERLAD